MSETTFFAKPCPACGRLARIAIALLGQQVKCLHCGRQFCADDPHGRSAADDDPLNYWVNFTQPREGPVPVRQQPTGRLPR
jgi:hypothetical protein